MVLRSHGWGGSRTTSLNAFRGYLDAGMAVLSFDQRGFGQSGGTAPRAGPRLRGRGRDPPDHLRRLQRPCAAERAAGRRRERVGRLLRHPRRGHRQLLGAGPPVPRRESARRRQGADRPWPVPPHDRDRHVRSGRRHGADADLRRRAHIDARRRRRAAGGQAGRRPPDHRRHARRRRRRPLARAGRPRILRAVGRQHPRRRPRHPAQRAAAPRAQPGPRHRPHHRAAVGGSGGAGRPVAVPHRQPGLRHARRAGSRAPSAMVLDGAKVRVPVVAPP
jgi:hypothetical protein